MRYFHRPAREAAEGPYLASAFGKNFEPFGQLSVGADVRVGTGGTELLEIDAETLAMHADSASWAFLTRQEAAWFRQMNGKPFGAFEALTGSHELAIDFTAHLWRRGLVDLDGRRAVSAAMFDDSPNYDEGHLVELLLTEKCNLACPYCLAGASQKMPAMDETIAMRTVDLAFRMREAQTLAFEFAGGEPFLKYGLMKSLVSYIRRHPENRGRRIFISVQTNATLLDDERARWLKDNDIRIGISLDGGAQAQNRSRPQVNGKESFSKLLRGIELLKKHEVAFGGLVVLNRANIGDPQALASFMIENQIHGFRINPVAYLGDARRNWALVGLEQDEIVEFFRRFMREVVARKQMILEDNVHSMLSFLTSKQRRTRCMRSQCGAGDSFQSVVANGDIYPCGRSTQSPGLKLGSIFDEGIESLSAPARTHTRIAEIRTRRPRDFDDCAVCAYRQLCQAGCSAQAWESYGTVRSRTPECTFYKTIYPWLMRWLSFDAAAFEHLERCRYFDFEGALFVRDFAATQNGAPPAGQGRGMMVA